MTSLAQNHSDALGLNKGLSLFAVMVALYSFGTFGFWNLFGLRTFIQALVIITFTAYILNFNILGRKKYVLSISAFLILYSLGGLFHGGILTAPIEAWLIGCAVVFFGHAETKQVIAFSRSLVIITGLLCLIVLSVYLVYLIYPDQLLNANIHIYDSSVGNQRIQPGHLLDWFSFTSGDGFVFQGSVSTRLKGYSNEPSSTLVHYLAPAVLAFILGGIYTYIGVFIILVNVIAIASFTAHIAILVSLVFVCPFFMNKIPARLTIIFALVGLVVLLVSPQIVEVIFSNIGQAVFDELSFDLVKRKLGDGLSPDSTLSIRQAGMIDGLRLIFLSPLGYSTSYLGAGSGWLYSLSATTGWLGVGIFVYFLSKTFRVLMIYRRVSNRSSANYGVALFFSLIFVALFVSGYGWERLPGYIVILALYKLVLVLPKTLKRQVI